mmetsp:Transcript_68151/g.152131  ORF Transcript_68151/g.152131 Transcript_68151/m.152131 type:complete len:99 (-) Transcript_68151:192-488(-)
MCKPTTNSLLTYTDILSICSHNHSCQLGPRVQGSSSRAVKDGEGEEEEEWDQGSSSEREDGEGEDEEGEEGEDEEGVEEEDACGHRPWWPHAVMRRAA